MTEPYFESNDVTLYHGDAAAVARTQSCVTHDLGRIHITDRPRPCFRRDQHYAACINEKCRGCVPRSATHGNVCPVCWAKITDALSRVEGLLTHLRSIEKAGQALGERVDTSAANRIILPEPWQAADGLMEALGAPPVPSTASIDDTFAIARDAVAEWSDLEAIVESREGAKRAVVLVKRMQAALTRWPDSEVDWRSVPLILCPTCGQATLYRRGPLHYTDELLIECAESPLMYELGLGYDYCQFSMDWFEWLETYSRPIEAAFKIHRKGVGA